MAPIEIYCPVEVERDCIVKQHEDGRSFVSYNGIKFGRVSATGPESTTTCL